MGYLVVNMYAIKLQLLIRFAINVSKDLRLLALVHGAVVAQEFGSAGTGRLPRN